MKDLIQQRLDLYTLQTPLDEERALREILQELVLFALYKVDFFQAAAFQGGTALRVLYGLNRFSEDLDFALKSNDLDFNWIAISSAQKKRPMHSG